ncbi:protein S100-G-like [Enoplosus armatus]|uniref:protein S100-G-like n=1 Tax=Enoplosus armatus TaxID=215367 RepID=UPI0039913B85
MLSSQIPLLHRFDLHKFSYNCATMSVLMQTMEALKASFDKYAGKEGDRNTLSKAELAELLRNEFPEAEASSKDAVDNFFSELDDDKDGVVTFQEYVTMIAILTVILT